MKKRIIFLSTMLIAGSLMFISCEKEEEFTNTEETTGLTTQTNTEETTTTTTTDGSTTTEGSGATDEVIDNTMVTGAVEEPEGVTVDFHDAIEGDEVDLEGEVIDDNGKLGIMHDGTFCHLRGNKDVIRRHLRNCVRVRVIKERDAASNAFVFKLVMVDRCDRDMVNDVRKVVFKGRLIMDNDKFGIIREGRFYELTGRLEKLRRFIGKRVEVRALKIRLNDGHVVYDIRHVRVCKEDNVVNPNEHLTIHGIVHRIDGKLGIEFDGRFCHLLHGPNMQIDHLENKDVKLIGILFEGPNGRKKFEIIKIEMIQ